MGRRIAVTGASGFIGGHLVTHLAARGDAVIRVQRPFQGEPLAAAFRGVDAVVHLAGVITAPREQDYVEGNAAATRIVAEASRETGVHLVYVSSLAAAGPAPPSAPRREEDPPAPLTAYGRSKLAGERAVADQSRLSWTVLRPGVVYGPRDRALLPLFRLSRRGVLPVVGRRTAAYTFGYVDDVVSAIVAATRGDSPGETFFVGHRQPVTARALIEGIRVATRGRAVVVPIPRPIVRLAAWVGDAAGSVRGSTVLIDSRRYDEVYAEGFVCCVDRLRDRLGVEAQVALDEGLRQTAQWYRSQGWA